MRQLIEVVLRGDGGVDSVVTLDPEQGARLGTGSVSETEPAVRVRCHGDVLLRVAAGDVNLAQAAHDGEVRVEFANGSNAAATRGVLKGLATLLRAGGTSGP